MRKHREWLQVNTSIATLFRSVLLFLRVPKISPTYYILMAPKCNYIILHSLLIWILPNWRELQPVSFPFLSRKIRNGQTDCVKLEGGRDYIRLIIFLFVLNYFQSQLTFYIGEIQSALVSDIFNLGRYI